jgi:invasion protein IalB
MTFGAIKSRTTLFVLAGLAALAATAAQAQSVRLLGDFRDWSAYTASEGAGKLCFVMTQPEETDPTPDGYADAYLYLTHRVGDGVHNELNLIAGYAFAPDTPAEATIGGQTYQLFTEDDAAWLEDVTLTETVAGRMRAGTTMTIEGTTERGIKIRQTFSLSGVTAASRAIDAEC